MKTLLCLFLLIPTLVWADPYVTVGHGFRDQSYRAAVGYLHGSVGAEIGFSSMGKQPAGYNNINRMAEINLAGYAPLGGGVVGFGKFGVNNTKWSHNGTNTYDRSGDSLWGFQGGVGVEYPVTKNLTAQAQVMVYEYRQVNNPNMGGFTYPSIGLRWSF